MRPALAHLPPSPPQQNLHERAYTTEAAALAASAATDDGYSTDGDCILHLHLMMGCTFAASASATNEFSNAPPHTHKRTPVSLCSASLLWESSMRSSHQLNQYLPSRSPCRGAAASAAAPVLQMQKNCFSPTQIELPLSSVPCSSSSGCWWRTRTRRRGCPCPGRTARA